MTQQFYSRQILIVFFSLMLLSCVTINVYFPAAAAEKVAEQIVDDVLHSNEQPKKLDEKPIDNTQNNNQSQLNSAKHFSQIALLALIDFIIPDAQAGQPNISINSAKIRSLRSSMEKRQSRLLPYYKSGAVGFTNNALIASVSNAGLSMKKKSSVKKLIKAENNDRKALYTEIAKANGHPEWRSDIQKTFAKTWINKISSGWMYQSNSGKWLKK